MPVVRLCTSESEICVTDGGWPLSRSEKLRTSASCTVLTIFLYKLSHASCHFRLVSRKTLLKTRSFHLPLVDAQGDTIFMYCYLMRIPGCAPLSGDRSQISSPPGPAAITIPSDIPKRILRGAKLATTTVSLPINCSGL